MKNNQWNFWIDRGGTFTDVIAKDPQNNLTVLKLLSDNPEQYDDATLFAIHKVFKLKTDENIPQEKIASIKMGTTVATNALLEHHGEPTALAITQGFKDALHIAYQNRPDIFALNTILPKPLQETVIEIEERVDANGTILKTLNINKAKKDLEIIFRQGYKSIAIVLLHAYTFKQHELLLKDIAKNIGFEKIVVSHQTSPLPKLITRGMTTVIDAYLSPILESYIARIKSQIKNTPLFFMGSNGGLTESNYFRGKDSIISGPAGGLIGAIHVAKMAGLEKIISFDMGGTSTDVAHYTGVLERNDITEIAGTRIQTPMLAIHTIAAGGGSILKFEQDRMQVGPESAGAKPGPSCYRNQGPLTITDCNVFLGRIQKNYFPRTFGPNANQAIDVVAVKDKFTLLTEEINSQSKETYSPEEIASGYLTIAVNNMAQAIKKISIERGHDISNHGLCCFGGAAGQHACDIAEVLGLKKIIFHPLASVLSAYGIGLAETRLIKESPIQQPFTKKYFPALTKSIHQLEQSTLQEFEKQNPYDKNIAIEVNVLLHYYDNESKLLIGFSRFDTMIKAFESKYLKEYGYLLETNKIAVEEIVVEVIGKQDQEVKATFKKHVPSNEIKHVKIYLAQAWRQVPLYHRDQLSTHTLIPGPALIIENNSTTLLINNWQAYVDNNNILILEEIASEKKPQRKQSQRISPILLEVFNHLFMSVAEQMGNALKRTAFSINIKERLDYSCALFDKQGNLIANAPHIPVHLGSMGKSVKAIIEAFKNKMQREDQFILNNPYAGGTHLPDITVVKPVYVGAHPNPDFFVASRAHHADIGGTTPGSIPAFSKTIYEEGVLINPLLCVRQGKLLEAELIDLLGKSKYPARNPKRNLTDLKAQIAANQKGAQELQNLVKEFSFATVTLYMKAIQDNAEASVKTALTKLSSGNFSYKMDNGALVKVAIDIDAKAQTASVDFSGTSVQQQNNFNAPSAVTQAAVLYVFRTLVAQNIPLNAGCLKPISIIIPEKNLLQPEFPAAVVAGNVETSQVIVDAIFGALKVLAASQGTMNNLTLGNDDFQYYETICGGTGAGFGFDGSSAVHSHMTNSLLTDPEVFEQRFPLLIKQFCIRERSGGKGRWSGGDGVIREIIALKKVQGNIVSNHRIVPPFGVAGGQPGVTGENTIQRKNGVVEQLSSTDEFILHAGDCLIIKTPGGGGFGS